MTYVCHVAATLDGAHRPLPRGTYTPLPTAHAMRWTPPKDQP